MSRHQQRQAQFLGQPMGRDADRARRDRKTMRHDWHQTFNLRRVRRIREAVRREYAARRDSELLLQGLIDRLGITQAIVQKIDQLAADTITYTPRRSNGEIL